MPGREKSLLGKRTPSGTWGRGSQIQPQGQFCHKEPDRGQDLSQAGSSVREGSKLTVS